MESYGGGGFSPSQLNGNRQAASLISGVPTTTRESPGGRPNFDFLLQNNSLSSPHSSNLQQQSVYPSHPIRERENGGGNRNSRMISEDLQQHQLNLSSRNERYQQLLHPPNPILSSPNLNKSNPPQEGSSSPASYDLQRKWSSVPNFHSNSSNSHTGNTSGNSASLSADFVRESMRPKCGPNRDMMKDHLLAKLATGNVACLPGFKRMGGDNNNFFGSGPPSPYLPKDPLNSGNRNSGRSVDRSSGGISQRADAAIDRLQYEVGKMRNLGTSSSNIGLRSPNSWTSMGTPGNKESLDEVRAKKEGYRRELEVQIAQTQQRRMEERRLNKDSSYHPLGPEYAPARAMAYEESAGLGESVQQMRGMETPLTNNSQSPRPSPRNEGFNSTRRPPQFQSQNTPRGQQQQPIPPQQQSYQQPQPQQQWPQPPLFPPQQFHPQASYPPSPRGMLPHHPQYPPPGPWQFPQYPYPGYYPPPPPQSYYPTVQDMSQFQPPPPPISQQPYNREVQMPSRSNCSSTTIKSSLPEREQGDEEVLGNWSREVEIDYGELKTEVPKPRVWQTSDELPSEEYKTAVYKEELKKQIKEKKMLKSVQEEKERVENLQFEASLKEEEEEVPFNREHDEDMMRERLMQREENFKRHSMAVDRDEKERASRRVRQSAEIGDGDKTINGEEWACNQEAIKEPHSTISAPTVLNLKVPAPNLSLIETDSRNDIAELTPESNQDMGVKQKKKAHFGTGHRGEEDFLPFPPPGMEEADTEPEEFSRDSTEKELRRRAESAHLAEIRNEIDLEQERVELRRGGKMKNHKLRLCEEKGEEEEVEEEEKELLL